MISIVLDGLEQHKWYSGIIYYLKIFTYPEHLVDHEQRVLILKDSNYCIELGGLGWRNPNGLVLQRVDDV